MHLKHSYIIFHLLSLYCNIGANAERPAVEACEKIKSNYKSSVADYIVSGKKAALGEFPYIVALAVVGSEENIFYCGGSLISPTYVLTAAHCFDGGILDLPIFIRAGSLDVGNTEFDPNTDVNVTEKILHPKYETSLDYYDIALLRLVSAVKTSPNVSPICMETSEADPKGQLVVAGWGKIREDGPRSEALLKAYVQAVSHDECSEMYRSDFSLTKGITKEQLCADDPTGQQQDTCQGDSGGPLVVAAKDGQSRLEGVTSFGMECGSSIAAVYTRVASYLDWIEGIVWP